MSVEDDLRAAAKHLRGALQSHAADHGEPPFLAEVVALAARLEALADRRAQEEAVIAAAVAWHLRLRASLTYDEPTEDLYRAVRAHTKEPS